jgi:hypothetical protein
MAKIHFPKRFYRHQENFHHLSILQNQEDFGYLYLIHK